MSIRMIIVAADDDKAYEFLKDLGTDSVMAWMDKDGFTHELPVLSAEGRKEPA
jgi:hypothetical protein